MAPIPQHLFRTYSGEVDFSMGAGDLRRDVLGAVRRDYLRFWSRYDEEIQHLTGGKPQRFKLPE